MIRRLSWVFVLAIASSLFAQSDVPLPYPAPSAGTTTRCDVLVAGGTFGGVAAAIGAAGLDVWVIEDTDWVGGQVTSQGVAPLDEHRFIEQFGGTLHYDIFRKRVRDHYGNRNPGKGWVSRLCFEPRVGLKVMEDMLKESRAKVLLESRVTAVARDGDRVARVTVTLKDGTTRDFEPKFLLEATDLGDVYPLAGVPFRIGSDARSETGEPHADVVANPKRTQSFTYCFAVDFVKGNKELVKKPKDYERFRETQPYTLTIGPDDKPQTYKIFSHAKGTGGPFWTYRSVTPDIAMINWPGNDYRGTPILEADHQEAKDLALGFLYWLQNECPRDDGGKGYPEMRLRKDVMGTEDGLSKRPYIREGRRLKALTTIVEQDIVAGKTSKSGDSVRGTLFPDTVGVGLYPVDIHVCYGDTKEHHGSGLPTKPFQIPLGSLIPENTRNVLAAGKAMGVTHVTNGSYRLHPVEWNVGESAGRIAAFCLKKGKSPAEIRSDPTLLRELQKKLLEAGTPLFWYVDLKRDTPEWVDAQLDAIGKGAAVDPASLGLKSKVK